MGFDSLFRGNKGSSSKSDQGSGQIGGRAVNAPFEQPIPGVIDYVVNDTSVDLSTKLTWVIHLKDLGALGSPVDHPTVVRAFEIAKARVVQSVSASLPESVTTDSEDMQATCVLAENCRAQALADPQWARETAASEAAWNLSYDDRTVGFGPGRTLGLRMFVHERDSSVIVKAVSGMAVAAGARVGDVVIAIDGVFLYDAAMEAVRQGRGTRVGQVLSSCIKELALAHDRSKSPLPIVLRHYLATPTNAPSSQRNGGGERERGGRGTGRGGGGGSSDYATSKDEGDPMSMGRPGTAFAARQGAKQDIQGNERMGEASRGNVQGSSREHTREHTGEYGDSEVAMAPKSLTAGARARDAMRERRHGTGDHGDSEANPHSYARFPGDRPAPGDGAEQQQQQPPPRRLAAMPADLPPPRRLAGLEPLAAAGAGEADEEREERRRQRKREKHRKKKEKLQRRNQDQGFEDSDAHPVFRPLDGPVDPFNKYAALPALPALDRRG